MGGPIHRRGAACGLILGGLTLAGSAGCALKDMADEAWFQTKQSLVPRGDAGYRDDTADPSEDWSEVGRIGRGDRDLVEEDEDWYRKYFMSEKHRQIERNLGFD